MREDFEVLSALLDGEVIEIQTLERALDDPRGRAALVDFARLRQIAKADDARPGERFSGRARSEASSGSRRLVTRGVPWPLAAAAVVIAMLAGSLVSFDDFTSGGQSGPPQTTRELRFQPGIDWQ